MGINAKIVSDEKISFDIEDELTFLKRKIFFWRKNEPDGDFYTTNQQIFLKGEEKVKNEANLFTII
jgi:hypothetical protein